MEEKEVRADTIYLVKHGSVAYGTNTPTSDIDEKGVAVPRDKKYYFGNDRFEQKDSGWADGNDRVIYDLRKFVALATDCNPNIVEVLYVDESDWLKVTIAGKQLLKFRENFLSQKAAHTFVGYAVAQLKRIEGHYKWLHSPPSKPEVEKFTNKHTLGIGAPLVWERKFGGHEIRIETFSDSSVEVRHIDHEAFDAAKRDYANYTHWKANRNPARAAIEAQYGYDCKHAYHLVRLLRMGKEILSEGKVLVKRPDRQELLDIRNGKYTYPELIEMSKDLKSEVDKALSSSPLPKEPDRKKIAKFTQGLVDYCVNYSDAYHST
jgi:predicted nucleotidyltransferase